MTKVSISITEEMNQLLNTVNSSGKKTLDELADILKIPRAKAELLMFQLLREELVIRELDLITRSELTDEGKHILREGLPENQLLSLRLPFGLPPSSLFCFMVPLHLMFPS